ncbi:transcription antitermination factor NusB [Paenibacillus sp. IHBB 10380]|uniref:transcription antitermination factor NusB n=1 Tax=Paenibacillus sp. IHBB 10380 TaxID=1566358 RepID=UPI0005CFCA29|nr:transcription antitermination factor NusB [Paenibacillus sp. IHBB 10380]AJS57944.1 nitrogen utilization protein B [Paenibacillus sp. IHBB 10380]
MKRRIAREIVVQSLYQMEMNLVDSEIAVSTLLEEASEENETDRVIKDEIKLKEYVLGLVNGTWTHKVAIDELLGHYLVGWQISRLSRVDRQVLRLATFEMVYEDDVPAKVVVNEAIDLAKHFGTEDSGKFVNGVLGNMIKDLERLKEQRH